MTSPTTPDMPVEPGEEPNETTAAEVASTEEASSEQAPTAPKARRRRATSSTAAPARKRATRSSKRSEAVTDPAAEDATEKAAETPAEASVEPASGPAPGAGADETAAENPAPEPVPARAPRRRRVTAAQTAPEAAPAAEAPVVPEEQDTSEESSSQVEAGAENCVEAEQALAAPADVDAEDSAGDVPVGSADDTEDTDSTEDTDGADAGDKAEDGTVTDPCAEEADAVAEAPRLPAASLLFQAPDPARARRRRKVTAVQSAPRTAPEPETTVSPSSEQDEVQDRAEEQPAASAAVPRGRRRRKVTAAQAAPEAAPAPDEQSAPQAAQTAGDDTQEEVSAEDARPRRSRRGRGRRARTQDAEATDTEATATADSAEAGAEPTDSATHGPERDLDEDEAPADETAGDGEESEAADGTEGGRRKRRRGGRGRRSRSRSDESGESVQDGGAPAAETPTETEDAEEPEEDEESGSGSRRRRRRRSRASRSESGRDVRDEVTALKGSTRLEAKRQRRREGRAAGRRRPIVTEAEFLARRESVDRQMIVREQDGLNQIAVLEDGLLVEHYVARRTQTSMVGNVYVGRVQNVLPSMEAAFVDLGKGRNAVLYAGEVNWDAAGMEGKPRRIEDALKSGDTVLVQVTKDPIGHKGARLTSQITLAGRYLVLVPGGSMTGISRKLPDTERARLKKILKKIVPDAAGVIVRTAAEGASEELLTADVERLVKQWESIDTKATRVLSGSGKAPVLLKGEPELAVRVVRDVFNEDFRSLVVQGPEAWATISEYVTELSPDLADRLQHWVSPEDVFSAHRIDEQLAKGFDRKVWLPSGGTLIIDRTEAMTVIDVNTGRFTGAGGTLEETVTRNNLEAAEEIVRQLRLRDIGGMVVIDFVDMVLESNRDLVLRRLVECLGRDRTRHQVTEVTSLGLVQMTRKRVGQGLVEAFSTPCECCGGRGFIVHSEPVENQQSELSASAARATGRARGRKASAETPDAQGARKGSARRRGKEDADDVIDDQTRAAVRGALAQIAAAAENAHKESETVAQAQAASAEAAEPAPTGEEPVPAGEPQEA